MSPDPTGELFAGIDPEQLHRVVADVGTAVAAAVSLATMRLIRDPAIGPEALTAGVIAAHLYGAASGCEAANRAGVLNFWDQEGLDAFCADAGRFIAAVVKESR